MLVKGVFTNIAGSIGGMTASHNKGGQYLRARTTPVNPNTSAQQEARSRFTASAADWAALTEAEREDWNNFAELQAWTNKMGDAIQLSGQNHFIAMNSALKSVGLATVTVPPTPNTRPDPVIIPAFAYDITTDSVPEWPVGTMGAGDKYAIGVSPILPPGVSAYKGPYRITGTVVGTGPAGTYTGAVGAAILARNPTIADDDRVAVRIRGVLATGQYSAYSQRISGPTVTSV